MLVLSSIRLLVKVKLNNEPSLEKELKGNRRKSESSRVRSFINAIETL